MTYGLVAISAILLTSFAFFAGFCMAEEKFKPKPKRNALERFVR